jgi:hypothetical protein
MLNRANKIEEKFKSINEKTFKITSETNANGIENGIIVISMENSTLG